MDQELKQRLIGAAVITALAAIFVPMLFDDPADETGKTINALTIPEIPSKVQDVDIAPLPQKAEDVVPAETTTKAAKPVTAFTEGEGDFETPAPRPEQRLNSKDTAVAVKRLRAVNSEASESAAESSAIMAEAEDVAPIVKPAKPAVLAPATQPSATLPAAPKTTKPASKLADAAVTEAPSKSPITEGATRWYLNAGSFSQKANAVSLQDTLKQQGFAATIKETVTDKGTVFKVRIGPLLDKVKAQAVKNKLTQLNVNSFVSPDE
jgi:DedD protein